MRLTEKKLNRIMDTGICVAENYSVPLLVFHAVDRKPQTATGLILETRGGLALATAAHVIKGYVELGEKARLQVGHKGYVLKDLSDDRIKLSSRVDLGLIGLTAEDLEAIGWPVLPMNRISASRPRRLDLLAYVGFPGCWKEFLCSHEIQLTSFKCNGTVETVEPDQFSIRIDDHRYEVEGEHPRELEDPGGISGAPVFSIFDFWNSREREPLLVGFITEGFAWSSLAQKHYAVHSDGLDSIAALNR